MQITKLLNDKEIKHGLLLVEKYPKPINKNNVVNTNSSLLQFYSGNDGAGRKFYEYMNPERLKAIGKGETEIRNRCANNVVCSDKEQEFNRRTEFKFVKN